MMPHYIDENLSDAYLQNGKLLFFLMFKVSTIEVGLDSGKPINLSAKDQQVYQMVQTDLNNISTMLNSTYGTSVDIYSTKEIVGKSGYYLKYTPDTRYNNLTITKNEFYWQIQCEFDYMEDNKPTRIINYTHYQTNGSLTEIKQALACTKHLFPERHGFHKFEKRSERQNRFSFINLCSELIDNKLSSYDRCPDGDVIIVTFRHYSQPPSIVLNQLNAKLKEIYPTKTTEVLVGKDYPMIQTKGQVFIANKDTPKTFLEKITGLKIHRCEIIPILKAVDKQKEKTAAEKFNVSPTSLQWLVAKAVWNTPEKIKENEENKIDIHNDVNEMVRAAKAFTK